MHSWWRPQSAFAAMEMEWFNRNEMAHKMKWSADSAQRSLRAAGLWMRLNESMLAPWRERVEQLQTGDVNHGTENRANLPPSVAREGGQEYYHKSV